MSLYRHILRLITVGAGTATKLEDETVRAITAGSEHQSFGLNHSLGNLIGLYDFRIQALDFCSAFQPLVPADL